MRMVADIEPDIYAAIYVSETVGNDVVATVGVDAVEIGRGRDGVVFSAGKRPVAPLLAVGFMSGGVMDEGEDELACNLLARLWR
jgi:hypothetical protein